MKRFLNRNPSETILVSVKEHRPRNNSRSFEGTFRSLVEGDSVWWLGEDLPTLGDVRGKIVLLRRFNSSQSLGIDATNWGHDGFFQGRKLFGQDRFELPNAALKWKIIERALIHAGENESNRRIHLNYCSGYVKNLLGLPSITEISTPIGRNCYSILLRQSIADLGVLSWILRHQISRWRLIRLTFQAYEKVDRLMRNSFVLLGVVLAVMINHDVKAEPGGLGTFRRLDDLNWPMLFKRRFRWGHLFTRLTVSKSRSISVILNRKWALVRGSISSE